MAKTYCHGAQSSVDGKRGFAGMIATSPILKMRSAFAVRTGE
jgi:hypothetical protein